MTHPKTFCYTLESMAVDVIKRIPSLEVSPAFYIREVPIYGDAILAPMDGYSDWPFRSLCRALGSAMSYTEFVKVEKILSRSKEPAKRLYFEEAERPITFQIYGDDPDLILKAALQRADTEPGHHRHQHGLSRQEHCRSRRGRRA